MPTKTRRLPDSYTTWMGMPVILKISTGEVETTLLCTIIAESVATVRVRIADQWDVDLYKEMILVVDAFPHAAMDLASQNAEVPDQSVRPSG